MPRPTFDTSLHFQTAIVTKWLAALFLALPIQVLAANTTQILDRFDAISAWAAIPAGKAKASIARGQSRQGSSLRIDFDFSQGGGEILVHRRLPLTLPDNYALVFTVRGTAQQPLEVRLVDASEQNVWRYNPAEFRVPPDWQTVRVKQRQFDFGWGPLAGGKPQSLGLIEFVIGRGAGQRGSIWIDDLRLEPRPPGRSDPGTLVVTASSSQPGLPPSNLQNPVAGPGWHSATSDQTAWLQLDFTEPREYGGLILDWDAEDYASHYVIQQSNDGKTWVPVYRVSHGNGQRDYLPLRESESRYLRLQLRHSHSRDGFGLRRLEIAPLTFSASSTQLFEWLARDAARGLYPRYLWGEQTYWAITGGHGSEGSGANREALLNLDGQLESAEGAFSVEPFLYFDQRLHTWADGSATPSLARGDLPIPSVRIAHGDVSLTVNALGGGMGEEGLLAHYEIENTGQRPVDASLFLAVRPFLVNPPWQATHTAGGVSSIQRLRYHHDRLWVDGHVALIPLTPPDQVGVLGFDDGPLTDFLARNSVPSATAVDDAMSKASGALRYAVSLAPGAKKAFILSFPGNKGSSKSMRVLQGRQASPFWAQAHGRAVTDWVAQLDQVQFHVPPSAEDHVRAVRSTLAYILLNRDGPALRPGSRRYSRTWIRDAALTSSALLALGHQQEVRAFLDWFAQYQAADGMIPCCLDPWGPDSMIEHDSTGEFIYTVANYVRFAQDRRFLERLWPRVMQGADYLISLRQKRLEPAFTQGDAQRFFGLLPESASHEGYMAHPVHSYWDDYWAIRGLEDAAWLAAQLGKANLATRYAEAGRAMRVDVEHSIQLTQAHFNINYVPGSAELGDFDPTSSAIAPVLGMTNSPTVLATTKATFKRYFAEVEARNSGTSNWKAYTPYEFRNVAAMIRLGERGAAQTTLNALLKGRRPPEWNQWPEVVWRDTQSANFIGDLPHTWVGAEFIQAFLSMFAYERAGNQLVLAAGLPRNWVTSTGGVGVAGLQTPFGTLNYHVQETQSGETLMEVGPGLRVPLGGLVIDPPLPFTPTEIRVNGVQLPISEHALVIHDVPARIIFRP